MDNYENKLSGCTSLDDLFEIWRNKPAKEITYLSGKKSITKVINHGDDFFISDGIVNQDVWNSGEQKRILYVLKEAYGTDWGDKTLASWLRIDHPRTRIWSRIARLTYGIEHSRKDGIARYKEYLSDSEHAAALDQIAILNLKKSGGESTSNYDEIDAYAASDKNEILAEINLIDPEIIVCGSTFGSLLTKVLCRVPLTDETRNDNWYYYMEICGRERLVIDYYHPANHWPDLMNYYGLIGIYQQALLRK